MAGCFAEFTTTTGRETGWTRTGSPSGLTIHSGFRRPCTWRTFTWKKECSARIAISRKTTTAMGKFMESRGTIRQKATLITSGPAAPDAPRPGEPRGRRLDALRTPSGLRRFERRGDKLFQRSMTDANVEWEIVQTKDTITPGNSHFSMKSLRAKLMNKDGAAFSQMPADDTQLAHANSSMTCYACHTSWTPTCFGCHLQMTANVRRPMLHNEGLM